MKTERIYWAGEINKELVDLVAEKLNSFSNEEDTLALYLNSQGGNVACEKVLTDMLEGPNIYLIGVGQLSSAAFSLFFLANCNKRIIPGIVGMYHTSAMDLSINMLGKPSTPADAAFMRLLREDDAKDSETICNLLEFSPEVREKLFTGEAIYFNTEDMQKFLNISESKRLSSIFKNK